MDTIATSLAAAALAAAGLFTGAGAQDQQVMEMPTPPAEMVEQINAGYDAEAAGIAAFDCADDDRACLSDELIERYRVDQWSRGLMANPQMLCGEFAVTHEMSCLQTLMGTADTAGGNGRADQCRL